MLVKDAMVMTPLKVNPDAKLREILEEILGGDQAGVAVVDTRGTLLGLVGTHDVLRMIVPNYVDQVETLAGLIHEGYFEERFNKLAGVTAEDVMSREVDVVKSSDTIIKAAAIFVEHNRKVLPVVDKGQFVGMITRRSLLERIARDLP
jgi:CBS domain-containing protein